jgi:pimeloyl-ACP methyl ester carboxylesterase
MMADIEVIERYVTSQDGLRLFVRDFPGPRRASKTPLLCIPGLTRNSKDFWGLAKTYATERRVICPDIRGRGLSDYDPSWRNYDPVTYIGDMRAILCALGVHGVVVVGTSMGGIMAMGMAAAMPTMLRGMVINDVGPRVERQGLATILTYLESFPTFNTWSEAGQHLRQAFADQVPINDDETWARAARNSYTEKKNGDIVLDMDPNVILPLKADQTEMYDLWYLFEAARRFPMLVVRGMNSVILDSALLDEMKSRNPNMHAVEVPDFGHAPFLTEESSAAAIRTFLSTFDL